MKYQIKDFTAAHVTEAEVIALKDYERERREVPALPPVTKVPALLPYAENGLGVAAFAGETLVGFLCTVSPYENAIRDIGEFKTGSAREDVSFRELAQDEVSRALPLEHHLDAHMTAGPTFMLRPSDTETAFVEKTRENGARIFVAETDGDIVAFLKAEKDGETFIVDNPGYFHITGAFCLPGYRGKGLYTDLLHFAVRTLKENGYEHLGVDYESINPAADRFWGKYFHPYTHSVTRRIDEHVFRKYN